MYDFRPIEIGNTNIIEMAELLSLVFPETDKFSQTFLQWQYVENPVGRVVGFNAYDEDELAAHYATIPVKWEINGELKKGLLSLNTATHPNHRGKKLFTQLAEKTYELGKELGYEFVIGVANSNSTPGFLRKLDFQLITPLDAFISLSSTNRNSSSYASNSKWDEDALNWRFQNPSSDYSQSKKSVLSKTHIGPLKAVMHHRSEGETLPLPRTFSPLKLHIGWNNAPSGLSFKIPKKMQPSPLNLIYRPLSDHALPTKEEIRFRLLDFDAY